MQVTVNTNLPVTATLGAARATVAWTLTNAPLVTGPNIITAQSFSPQPDGTTNASLPVTRVVFLVPALPVPPVKSTLTLATSGNGKIAGMANNASLEVNKVYKVTAVPGANSLFTNWTSGTNAGSLTPLHPDTAALSFVMSSNLILQANFVTNPFPAVAGVYNGLFAPATGVTEESSGFFTATLPPSGHGTYSAKLLLNGGTYPFSGTFNLSGDAGTTLARSKDTSLIVELHLNLAAPDDQITGSIIDGANPGWISQLQADRNIFNARSNPATNAGRYTLVFPPGPNAPTNDPGGYGYATLTNNPSGQVSLVGQLGRRHCHQPIRPRFPGRLHSTLPLSLFPPRLAAGLAEADKHCEQYSGANHSRLQSVVDQTLQPGRDFVFGRLYQHKHDDTRLALPTREHTGIDQRHIDPEQRKLGRAGLQQPDHRKQQAGQQ